MALNIGEANDLNTVLRYFLGLDNILGEKVGHDSAREAAERLADKAHKPLMAGLTSDDVRNAWPALELPSSDDAIIRWAAAAYLHGDDEPGPDLGALADALGIDHDDVEALVDRANVDERAS